MVEVKAKKKERKVVRGETGRASAPLERDEESGHEDSEGQLL